MFLVDPRDAYVARALAETGEYSPEELVLLRTCVTPDSDVLVVGAHIGAMVVPLSRACRRLDAVEANPVTFDLLLANLKLNSRTNVEAHYGAASDSAGEPLRFLCGTHNSGGSKRMPVHARADYTQDNPTVVEVPTLKLDDVFAGRTFSLIHMDIEGSEVFALRGAQTLLPRTRYLSVEFISHHLTHVANVTVDEWLAPIRPHFNVMALPGSAAHNRPHVFLEPADWHEMLQNIVDAGAGIEGLIFWKQK